MTETGYAVGFILRAILTIVFLGAAGAAVRYGWDRAGRRRPLLFHPIPGCPGHRSRRAANRKCGPIN